MIRLIKNEWYLFIPYRNEEDYFVSSRYVIAKFIIESNPLDQIKYLGTQYNFLQIFQKEKHHKHYTRCERDDFFYFKSEIDSYPEHIIQISEKEVERLVGENMLNNFNREKKWNL